MSTATVSRPKPSVKRRVETWLETRQRHLKIAKECLMDPTASDEWHQRSAIWIGRLEEEIRQHLAQGGK